jgi:hypothetical protein
MISIQTLRPTINRVHARIQAGEKPKKALHEVFDMHSHLYPFNFAEFVKMLREQGVVDGYTWLYTPPKSHGIKSKPRGEPPKRPHVGDKCEAIRSGRSML